jgi:formylglycine-generating enzyme required for sulfatase activity
MRHRSGTQFCRFLQQSLLGIGLSLVACSPGLAPPRKMDTRDIPIGNLTFGPAGTNGAKLMLCDTTATTPTESWKGCDARAEEPITWLPAAVVPLEPHADSTNRSRAFAIDANEVTNHEYKVCVENFACPVPLITSIQLDDNRSFPYYDEPEFRNYPKVNVTFYDAAAYCAAQGKQLPTEAQWEWAARANKLNAQNDPKLSVFPWGDDFITSCDQVMHGGCSISDGLGVKGFLQPGHADSSDITLGAEVKHMASNVAEWVRDPWNACAYCESENDAEKCGLKASQCDEKAPTICTPNFFGEDPSNYSVQDLEELRDDDNGVIRGGSYRDSICFHRLYVRRKLEKKTATSYVGFRCVKY